jgi:hypothetical protein
MRRSCFLLLLLLPSALQAADGKLPPGVTVDLEKKAVIVDAKVAPRKLPHLDQSYPIEVIACWGYVKDAKPGDKNGKKSHETVVTIDVMPSDVAQAMAMLGLKPGKPAVGETEKAEGPLVTIAIDVPQEGGGFLRLPLEKILVDPKTNKPMPKGVKFLFTGSASSKAEPGKDAKPFGADNTGSLIMLFPVDAETVFQSTLTMKEEKYLKLDVKKDALPKEGSPVKLVIEVAAAK